MSFFIKNEILNFLVSGLYVSFGSSFLPFEFVQLLTELKAKSTFSVTIFFILFVFKSTTLKNKENVNFG